MNRRLLLIILAIIVVVGGVALYKSNHTQPVAGAQLSDKQVQDIIGNVGKLIKLPQDEKPLVATVADINQLVAKEPFYTGAKNGDILLLYPNAGKAILYAPDENMIVNVGPIILDQNAQQKTTTTTKAPASSTTTATTTQ